VGNVRIFVPDDLHQDLKHEAINQRVALKDLIVKALQEYIEHRKEQKD